MATVTSPAARRISPAATSGVEHDHHRQRDLLDRRQRTGPDQLDRQQRRKLRKMLIATGNAEDMRVIAFNQNGSSGTWGYRRAAPAESLGLQPGCGGRNLDLRIAGFRCAPVTPLSADGNLLRELQRQLRQRQPKTSTTSATTGRCRLYRFGFQHVDANGRAVPRKSSSVEPPLITPPMSSLRTMYFLVEIDSNRPIGDR